MIDIFSVVFILKKFINDEMKLEDERMGLKVSEAFPISFCKSSGLQMSFQMVARVLLCLSCSPSD